MSLSSPLYFLIGTATFADTKELATFMTVAKMARQMTVKIHSSFGGGGSGVIINRQGNTYTVLTANHVVNSTGVEYTIHTHQKKDYPVTTVLRLQQCVSELDFAVVQFSSPDAYPVATLGNSDAALIGTTVYVAGYPATTRTKTREFDFINGIIIGHPNGELLRYNTTACSGMSGAPVFNALSQVIGIYVAREVDQESKTGCKIAVPINTIITLLNQTPLSHSDLRLDLTPDANDPALPINANYAQACFLPRCFPVLN